MGSTGHMWGTQFAYSKKPTVKAYLDKQHTEKNETTSWTILRSATKGSVYYAACERLSGDERTVFALVQPYSFYGRDFDRELVVKDQDESMGPYDVQCPNNILDLLTEPINDNAREWRENCRIYNEKREVTVEVGDTLVFEHPLNFTGYGKVSRFLVHRWDRKKRFLALAEARPFNCMLDRWTLANVPYTVEKAT